jgi:hypothetical protein
LGGYSGAGSKRHGTGDPSRLRGLKLPSAARQKLEIRISTSETMAKPKSEIIRNTNSKRAGLESFLNFSYLKLFRVSDFEFDLD